MRPDERRRIVDFGACDRLVAGVFGACDRLVFGACHRWAAVVFGAMLGSVVMLSATSSCVPAGEETTDDANGATVGAGGAPSVASAITTVGAGGGNTGIQCPGIYTTIAPGECDLLLQDCGPNAGCKVQQQGGAWTTSCVATTGVKGAGDSCVNDNSCGAGLYCVFNRCSPVCCPNTNEPCGVNGICNVDFDFGAQSAQMCSYLASCTLFTGECEGEANCYPLMDDGNSVCAPTQGVTVGDGEPCGAINDCNDSMVCSGSVCRFACYLDGNGLAPGAGGCPDPQVCSPGGTNPPQNIGICTP